MSTSAAVKSLERLAEDVFEVVKQLSLAAPRSRRHPGDLKEGEFLTLAMLHERGTLHVGEIQRELGVLPAQMSRIIRSLETREHAYVTCQLNPQDKRKIDVTLTDAGLKVLGDYSRHRVARILQVLRELDSDQQESLDAIIDRVRDLLRR